MSSIWSRLVNLASNVTGILGISNGGTGASTKAAAFDGLSPMTAAGDMIYGGTSGTGTQLATGVTAGVLHGGNGAVPTWSTIVNADVSPIAAIAYSKLNLATSIVDADVSASAAIAGSKLQAANGVTNAGVVSTGAQTIGGAKTFSSGIVVGGNTTGDSNLGTISSVTNAAYYVGSFTATWNSGFSATVTSTVNYVKIGRMVTLTFTAFTSSGNATGVAKVATAAGNLPSVLNPNTQVDVLASVVNSGLNVTGAFTITSGGSLQFFRSSDFTTLFTNAATIGFNDHSLSYVSAT